ncbi:hypothetical protein [uncultured Sunxiuqinia sp.]|uniref:hypothetical protein n=1 Tax=uncultured Sunxiuqinia sp. TaxID=1573825 RepID=UPI002AA8A494|nr:hypothetical protein [uncultured Sunxiuqinia sp.]
MTHKTLLEEFLTFEKENNLFKWEIDNVPIWELLRMSVFTDLKNKLVNENITINEQKTKKSIAIFFKFFINSIFHNPFIKSKQKDYLILNHPRRKLNSGIYEDVYIDPLLPHLNDNYVVLEGYVNLNKDHYRPIQTENLYYLDILQLPSRLISSLSVSAELSHADKIRIMEVETLINTNWNIQISTFEKKISKFIKRWNFVLPKIERLILKINPKKVLNVVSYSFINQAFTFCAHKNSIPVIEFQHGTVGKYHIAYNYSFNEGIDIKTFPDIFLAWGKNWVKDARLPIPINNIEPVGFPYYELFFKKDDFTRNPKQVTVISQYRKDIALLTKDIACALPDYEIIFKAHPAEYLDASIKYPFLTNMQNVRIVADDKTHLYNLFRQSSFVVGVHSTALLEALAFCPNVLIAKLPGWEYFEDLEENENLKFISNVNDFSQSVFKCAKTESNSTLLDYFEDESIKKIVNIIK